MDPRIPFFLTWVIILHSLFIVVLILSPIWSLGNFRLAPGSFDVSSVLRALLYLLAQAGAPDPSYTSYTFTPQRRFLLVSPKANKLSKSYAPTFKSEL